MAFFILQLNSLTVESCVDCCYWYFMQAVACQIGPMHGHYRAILGHTGPQFYDIPVTCVIKINTILLVLARTDSRFPDGQEIIII